MEKTKNEMWLLPWNWMCTGVLFLQIVCGVQYGWTINLTNEDFTPIMATEKQMCLLQLALFVGIVFGSFICMPFINSLGHYCTQISAALLMTITSGLGFFTYQYGIKAIISQFFGGIAHTFAVISYTIIISEISSPRKRGLFICQGLIAFFFGMLLYVFNLKFMNSFINLNGLMLSISICGYFFIYLFHMESPVKLISEGKIKNAHYILQQMSSDYVLPTTDKDLENNLIPKRQNDFYDNLVVLMELHASDATAKHSTWKLCCITVALKILGLLVNTHIIQTLMLGLVTKHDEPLYLQIFITVAQSPLMGLLLTSFWIDRISRRLLLLTCSAGIAASLGLAAIFNVWSDTFDDINWLHCCIFGLGIVQFLNGFGILGVTQTILGEIYPLKTKCYYLCYAAIFEMVLQSFLHFAVFSNAIQFLAVPWEMLTTSDWLSAMVAFSLSFILLLLASCLYKFLPETKGLNLKLCIDKFKKS